MFILFAIIIGLLIGFIRGGRIQGITAKKISLWPLGLIGVILQVALHLYYYTGGISAIDSFLPIVNFISYILVLIMFVFNLDDFWTILIAVGTTANFVVIFINGGKMPVAQNIVDGLSSGLAGTISQGMNGVYTLMDQTTTTLWFLGDYLRIPALGTITSLYGGASGLSVGTIIIMVGLIGWVQYAMSRAKAPASPFENDLEFGTDDYILPPSHNRNTIGEDEMDDRLFGTQEYEMDDFFAEDSPELFEEETFNTRDMWQETTPLSGNGSDLFEESSNFDAALDEEDDLTEIIPKLTPDMIDEIRQSALDGIGNPQEASEDSDTRVFSALNHLGSIDHEADKKEEKSSASTGFFTQSFYAEKQKEEENKPIIPSGGLDDELEPIFVKTPVGQPVNFEMDEPEELVSKEIPKIEAASDTIIQDAPKWNPREVQRSTYSSSSGRGVRKMNPYSTLNNRGDEQVSTGRSTEEMMNIWHQVAEENQQRKRNRKKTGTGPATVGNEEVTRIQAEPERKKMTRDEMAQKWDDGSPNFSEEAVSTKSQTNRIDTQAVRQVEEQVSEEKVKSSADQERERAGFEKVEIEIDGRKVAFWRKKKQ